MARLRIAGKPNLADVPELGLDLDLDPLKNGLAPTIAAIVITTMAIHFLRPCRVNLQVLK